jgi:hypothetical protein
MLIYRSDNLSIAGGIYLPDNLGIAAVVVSFGKGENPYFSPIRVAYVVYLGDPPC